MSVDPNLHVHYDICILTGHWWCKTQSKIKVTIISRQLPVQIV